MRAAAALLAAFLAAFLAAKPAVAAAVYRWTGADGAVRYSSEPPPAGVPARRLELDLGGGRLEVEAEPRAPRPGNIGFAQERAALALERSRGLAPGALERINPGMSERQLLSAAGTPDVIAYPGLAFGKRGSAAQRTYAWLPTPSAPWLVKVTVVGGWVTAVERQDRF